MADVAVQVIAESPKSEPARWSSARKVAFRFFFCYWLLYGLPESGRVSLPEVIPGAQFVTKYYEKMWHAFVPWVATKFFHVTGEAATYFPTGSGDTTLQYVTNLLYILIAIAATLVWSALDRKRPNYRRADAWLIVWVRYTLAFTLFAYGFAKVFPLQFGPPRFLRLVEPYGDFSPMGVLWSFMGASIPYIIFSGSAEVLGGLLLLFRRTTTLGAMVAAGVMLNVAALNYCYDVPVKLYSTNLFLMAVFLLAPQMKRLFQVLVLNRPVEPADLNPLTFERLWLRRGAMAFWVLFVGYGLIENVRQGWSGYKQQYITAERPPIYGLYDVESGGPGSWQKVSFESTRGVGIRTTDGKIVGYGTEYTKDSVTLNKKDKLTWTRPDADHLVLTGTLEAAAITLRLKRVDTSKFLLVNRGFHWINERPLNR